MRKIATTSTHGGWRKGSGRKQEGPEPRRPVSITMTDSEKAAAADLGAGNVSKGVSIAIQHLKDSR